ncbi:MAG: GIY-YIG nuclease family protein [Xanthomonadales bacterium]|nr:GIY-YIG nuclease family protein [Xanthomonadales bacterium]
MKNGFVYILSNKHNTVLYIGVSSEIIQRIWQHKKKLVDGFSKKYNVDKLVYFERHDSIEEAILREKQIKKWNRDWKNKLISELNPGWVDLYESNI